MKGKTILTFISILLIIIACYGILSSFYNDYKKGYEFCVSQEYVWPVDCRSPITFKEYKQSFSFVEAISSGYVDVTDNLLFSPYVFLLSIAICILICTNPFEKSDQKENSENIVNDNDIIKLDKKRRRLNPLKLIIGMLPFILVIIHGIKAYSSGFTFLSTSYGFDAVVGTIIFDLFIYSPIYLIAICLIFTYISDLVKKRGKK